MRTAFVAGARNVEKQKHTKEFMMSLACELSVIFTTGPCRYARAPAPWMCSLNEMHFNYTRSLATQDSEENIAAFILSFIRALMRVNNRGARESLASRCLVSVAFNEEIIYAKRNA